MDDNAYNVTADELTQFVERYEQLEAEKVDISESMKEMRAEIKGRGYDTKVFLMVIARRKRKREEIEEEESILEMYESAVK